MLPARSVNFIDPDLINGMCAAAKGLYGCHGYTGPQHQLHQHRARLRSGEEIARPGQRGQPTQLWTPCHVLLCFLDAMLLYFEPCGCVRACCEDTGAYGCTCALCIVHCASPAGACCNGVVVCRTVLECTQALGRRVSAFPPWFLSVEVVSIYQACSSIQLS